MTPVKQHRIFNLPQQAWVGVGLIFVVIGTIGFILPLMPGLVFFILAAYCFARGSRKLLRALLSNKHVGPQIMDWKRGKGMAVNTKIKAIAIMIPSMGFSVYLVHTTWVKYCIAACGVAALIAIVSVKTKK